MLLGAWCAQAASSPMTLVSEGEADPVRSAITRKEAWTRDASARLRAQADRRVKEGPWSVTFDRPSGIALDLHDYYSEAPYFWPNPDDPNGAYILHEGRVNPDRFTANRAALYNMSDAVFTLGAASYLFDDARYGQRAARIVHTWFINPKTRMNPHLENAQAIRGVNTGRPSGIIQGREFIRAIQGMEFLEESGGWDPKDQAAVHKWFEEYLRWLTQSRNGLLEKASTDRHATWWTAQVAAVATFVGDTAAARTAFDFYRDRVFAKQAREDTSSAREEARAVPGDSVAEIEAATVVCRIGDVQGVDLWGARGKNGSTLGSLIDNLQPYLSNPRRWSREQATDLETDGLSFLAFAGMGLKRPEYIALYQKLEHPDNAWLSVVDLVVGRWEASGHQTRH
ncbi:MAG: alginate lyase family protein [Acidobacteriia bacterium]|nr:alginate lyase family protein [Terriglobia bacterium]